MHSNLPDIYKKFLVGDEAENASKDIQLNPSSGGDPSIPSKTQGTNFKTINSDFKPQSNQENPDDRKGKNKNGLDDHKKLVESFLKQGAKFRRTMKYGFPVVARKTIQNDDDESVRADFRNAKQDDRMNQTATLAFKNKQSDLAKAIEEADPAARGRQQSTQRSFKNETLRSKGRNKTESPERGPGASTHRSLPSKKAENKGGQAGSPRSPSARDNLNINSELDSKSDNSSEEFNSEASSFLHKVVP